MCPQLLPLPILAPQLLLLALQLLLLVLQLLHLLPVRPLLGLLLVMWHAVRTALLLVGLEAVEQVAQPQQKWLHWNVNERLKLI